MVKRHCGMKKTVAGVAAAFLLLTGTLPAGSVFMKNGYILQGPVAEKTPEHVVLEWPNGRVIIPRRFIQAVVLEPKEEQQLRAKERLRAQVKAQPSEEELLEVNVYLPPNPEDLLPGRKEIRRTTAEKPRMTLPSVDMGERRELASGLFGSLPQGWTLVKAGGAAWVVEGPAAAGSQGRPRIAGIRLDSNLSQRRQIALAHTKARGFFKNWQVVDEGWRELGMHRAYELRGRGTAEGVQWSVRNIVAWVNGDVWLISCVRPAERQDARRPFEWFLQSLEFVTQ